MVELDRAADRFGHVADVHRSGDPAPVSEDGDNWKLPNHLRHRAKNTCHLLAVNDARQQRGHCQSGFVEDFIRLTLSTPVRAFPRDLYRLRADVDEAVATSCTASVH